MNSSKERKFGVLLSYLSISIRNILNLLLIPFIIHHVGVGHYGVYSLVASLAGYLIILELGLSNTVIRFLSIYQAKGATEKSSQFIGTMLSIYSLVSIVTVLIGGLFYLNLGYFFSGSLTPEEIGLLELSFLILLASTVITLIGNTYTGVISAYEKFTFQKLLEIFSFVIRCTLVVYNLSVGHGILVIALVDAVVNLFQTIIRVCFVHFRLKIKISFRLPDRKTLKEIFIYTFFIALNVIVNQVNWRLDNFIIGALTDSKSLGIFNIGSQFILSFIAFATAISGVFAPKIVKMVSLGASSRQLTLELVKIGRVQLIVLGFVFVAFVSYGAIFIELFVGKEFYLAFWAALIPMIPFMFVLVQTSTNAVLQALNKHRVRSLLLLFAAVLNVLVSVVLVKTYGMLGASIGTALTLLIGELILVNIYLIKFIKLDMVYFYIQLFRQCMPVIMLSGLISYCISLLLTMTWSDLILGCIASLALYCLLCFFFVLSSEEKRILMSIVKRTKVSSCEEGSDN